jgi:hypothetical protein
LTRELLHTRERLFVGMPWLRSRKSARRMTRKFSVIWSQKWFQRLRSRLDNPATAYSTLAGGGRPMATRKRVAKSVDSSLLRGVPAPRGALTS